MGFWFTTHWPHWRSAERNAPHDRVWVPDGKQDVIAPMKVGDLVWIYESQSGREILSRSADGTEKKMKHHKGRGGVVTLAEVTDTPVEHPEAETENYSDGSRIWWRWFSETRVVNSAGYISRADTNDVLGYKPNYPFKGFGTKHSGLKEISEAEHLELLSRFLESYSDIDTLAATQSHLGGKGGEGPVHLALKNYVASYPTEALGESGVELVKVEFPFGSTGDRIDVLLKDQFGRYVAVEIEPACDKRHDAGPLQCMKYRALLAYRLEREEEEIRTCLIAHDIHEAVVKKSESYGIECIVVDQQLVHK